MATTKKNPKAIEKKSEEESQIPKPVSNLIFISHDTRDAELAEEFSDLLKKASTGALKSFVSSDKKGTRGIEYGSEWYPAIMDKIAEATEVVCLLTQRSVERPWILYEAGVAKGKLGKKVIGIALGIPHTVAFTGPFAQFQNNDGSVDSISKLVLDLIRKVPGLDPDQQLVEQLVQTFHKKANEIVSKEEKSVVKNPAEVNENIVAKLFEEVKIMFETLPSKIENRMDPDSRRRRRKLHPIMFEEFMRLGVESKDPNLGFLMLISVLKDEFPWIYEVGLETYRGLKAAKTQVERKRLIASFEKAFDIIGHPMMRDFYGKSDDIYIFIKEFRFFVHRFFDRHLIAGEKEKE